MTAQARHFQFAGSKFVVGNGDLNSKSVVGAIYAWLCRGRSHVSRFEKRAHFVHFLQSFFDHA